MLDNKIGYIALRSFSPASADQFHAGLKKLLDQGATSIISALEAMEPETSPQHCYRLGDRRGHHVVVRKSIRLLPRE